MEIRALVQSDKELIFSPRLSTSRTEEKEALCLLNHRFVNFIEKVNAIVTGNEKLKAKIDQVRKVKMPIFKFAIKSYKKEHFCNIYKIF